MRNLVVLGMHRSGTSMVAGALASCGLYVGNEDELLFDQEDNPHGFFERRDVVDLNDTILAAAGGSWYQPPADMAAAQASDEEIAGLLSRLPADNAFLLKDPRMVLTWPQWAGALADSLVLYVYRHPMAVAESLRRRNSFPLQYGLALWEHYNRAALEIVGSRDSLAISYEAVTADPAAELTTLVDKLRKRGLPLERDVDVSAYDVSLGKSAAASADTSLLTRSQRELMAYAESLCRGDADALPQADDSLLARLADFAGAVAPLAEVHETQQQLLHYQELTAERTGERDRVLAELDSSTREHRALAQAHKAEIASHRALADEHQRLEGEHASLAEAHSREVSEHLQLQDDFEQLSGKADYLFQTLTRSYNDLLVYETSRLAAIQRTIARAYRLLTFRRGVRSRYEDVLEEAGEHLKHQEMPLPSRPPGKVDLLGDIVKYVFRNPSGSARSFSFQRFKRALQVFFSSNSEDLAVWVNSRFPEQAAVADLSEEEEFGPELDDLCLEFPAEKNPLVSIVIPVYNEYRVTLNALRSVLENTPDIPYEVIIADDCSTDLTADIETRVSNIKVVRGEENLRFIGNCNRAAQAAVGDYLLFLNNDTSVTAGWLEAIMQVFKDDAKVGIVGPKLIYPNGRLQEAGGIVWDDASAWNFGRMDDPLKPEYNYLKEVDYISGACLAIRSELWRTLDGFDTRYVPAYYEDTDIAFAARELGYRVVYQPLSTVIHYEGISNGVDLDAGIKQYQVDNQAKFFAKWQQQLQSFHFPNAEHVFLARDRGRERRSVLFIDHYVPHYDKDAGSRSTYQYVQLMVAQGYRVYFLGANFFPHEPYTRALQQMGVEVLVGEYMARNIDSWLAENAPYIDNVYIHRPHIAEQFLKSIDRMQPRPRVIYFGHDLHYLRHEREARVTGDNSHLRTAEKWRQREYKLFDQVDQVYYPSQVEVDEICEHRQDLSIRAIPLYALPDVTVRPFDFDATRDLLFVGGFNHPPNVDAVCWLVESVLPLVREQGLDCRFHIVGSNPPGAVKALASPQVVVHGYLEDGELEAIYRQIRLVVVPLRFGAGVKGKVVEAIQQGRMLITTSVGAEGIPDADSVMTIADSAEGFAGGIVELYRGSPEASERLSAYPDWLERHFSHERAAAIVEEDFGPPGAVSG